jgi:hypothetical protein
VIQTPALREPGNIAGDAREPGTDREMRRHGQESGGHGDKPNTLECASQVMSPISDFVYALIGIIQSVTREIVYTDPCPMIRP